jgi:RNA recognition motif-containing protein
VGNLPLEVTEDELRQVFVIFGEVVSVIIMNDKYIGSGQLRGYGYVQMPLKSQGQNAVLSLQDKRMNGQSIKVVEALPLTDGGQPKLFQSRKNKFSNMKTRQR